MRVFDEFKFYLSLASLLASLAPAAFLFNDLMNHRTYIYFGRMRKRKLITRPYQPAFYWTILGTTAASTLAVSACSLILMIEAVTGINIIEFGGNQALESIIVVSCAFIMTYLVSAISTRFLTFQEERLTELGLTRDMKKEQEEERQP